MYKNLVLPQTLEELSNIPNQNYPVGKWTGAVNIMIVEDHIAFIKRSQTMPTHKGQIGFMGGHKQDSELSPVETAQRELFEESGIESEDIEFIGLVTPVRTSRKKLIIPALIKYKYSIDHLFKVLKPNEEWDEMILCPIDFLLNPDHWSWARVHSDKEYEVYFAPLLNSKCINYPRHDENSYVLWGASAKMLWNLFQIYSGSAKN